MSFKQKLNNLIKFVKSSDFRYMYLGNIGMLSSVNDEEYIKRRYKIVVGKDLNLENPTLYTEKLQWLKLYDHNPKYTLMVDKYNVKNYVKEKIGEKYIIPTINVWDRFEDIDFDLLPNKFVLKCTHDSGSVVICKDKEKLNLKKVKKRIKKYLKRNYYICSREWPYKDVHPRILAEKYMEDENDGELRDYKFFTFNGEPKIVYITQGRTETCETVADFFDMNLNHLNLEIDHKMSMERPHPPKNFELMKGFARILSEGTPQLRVDFYEVNGNVFFGEMTFFHCSGLMKFTPNEWDLEFGKWVTLPEKQA